MNLLPSLFHQFHNYSRFFINLKLIMIKSIQAILSLLFPIFYCEVRSNYNSTNENLTSACSSRVRTYRRLISAIFVLESVRCLVFSYALHSNWAYYQSEVELYFSFMNRHHSMDKYTYLCLALLFLYLGYFHHLVYVSPRSRSNWTFLYDLLVRNSDQLDPEYTQKFNHEIKGLNLIKLGTKFHLLIFSGLKKARRLICEYFWDSADASKNGKGRIFLGELEYFDFLPVKFRLRTVLVLTVVEIGISVAAFAIG